jgi:hypothetical protein
MAPVSQELEPPANPGRFNQTDCGVQGANRNRNAPDNRNKNNGFRVASTFGGWERRHADFVRICQSCQDHDLGECANERSGPFMMRRRVRPAKRRLLWLHASGKRRFHSPHVASRNDPQKPIVAIGATPWTTRKTRKTVKM